MTSQLGYDIDLLTYGEGVDVAIPGVKIIRIPRFPRLGDVKVGPSLLKLFLDIFMVAYTVRLLIAHRYEVVHAHEEAVFFCRFLKPIFHFKLIYDMHSSLPQQLSNFQFTTSRFLVWIFKKLEDSCLRKADAVITICPDLANYVDSLLHSPEKHFLIENSIFDPIKLADQSVAADPDLCSRQSASLPKFGRYIVYAGTLEAYQGIDILIPAFRLFLDRHADFTLLIVGGNPQQVEKYSALARECRIEQHCIFTGQVSQSMAKHYSSRSEILVSPRSKGTNTPLKIYEQIASTIPLVATRIHSHEQVLDDTVAILVDPHPEDLAKGLEIALQSDGKEKAMNARKLYLEKYSRQIYTGKMEQLFAHIRSSIVKASPAYPSGK